jgi:hypothetical protein
MASANVDPCFAEVLTTGNLIAFYKLSAENRKLAGCCFLRWAFKLAVRSPEARKAAQALAPLQLGMAERGAEAYCHSLRAL